MSDIILGAHVSAAGGIPMAPPRAKAIGPPPPRMMPALAHLQPSLRQRMMARFAEWRAKEKDLPEGW